MKLGVSFLSFLLLGLAAASGAAANERDEYNLRAATEDLAVFHRLERDGVLRREDAATAVDFAPRFDAADVNRDGVLTAQEMHRYIEQTYGLVYSSSAGSSAGGDPAERKLRAATDDLALFHKLARDGVLHWADVIDHPKFGPRFAVADVNRDGMVTRAEMDRFIEEHYGIKSYSAASAGSRSSSAGSSSAGSSRPAPARAAPSASAGSGRK